MSARGRSGSPPRSACDFYGLPFQLFEEDAGLSSDTKAGTILTRTLEAFRRYGVADRVLAKALRVDEIGDVERATNTARPSVRADLLAEETRYPFVINMPQHHLEPILHHALEEKHPGAAHLRHKLLSFRQTDDGVVATFETPDGVQRDRRLVSARLRRRAQHDPRPARHSGRGRVARTRAFCWST